MERYNDDPRDGENYYRGTTPPPEDKPKQDTKKTESTTLGMSKEDMILILLFVTMLAAVFGAVRANSAHNSLNEILDILKKETGKNE